MKVVESSKGISLIEIVIALGIMTIILTGVASVSLSAINNARQSRNQNLATQFSQEGMEIVKNLEISDWTSLYNLAGDPSTKVYCLDENQNTLTTTDIRLTSYPGCKKTSSAPSENVGGFFARQVSLGNLASECTQGSNPTIKAIVAVSWSSPDCGATGFCHKSELTSCLYEL